MFLRRPPHSLLWVSVTSGRGRDDSLLTASLSLLGASCPLCSTERIQKPEVPFQYLSLITARHLSQNRIQIAMAPAPGVCLASLLYLPSPHSSPDFLCSGLTHTSYPICLEPSSSRTPLAPPIPHTALRSKHIPIRGLPWHPSIMIPPSHFLAFTPLYFS